jgi:hypothetical protein
VVSLDRSKETLCTTDLGVSELFARSERLYLSGTEGGWQHRGSGALDIFVKRGESWVRERRLGLGPQSSVQDLDPLSETGLIVHRRDLTHVSTWTLMDLETGKTIRELGEAQTFGFFLARNEAPS